jgi:hypothetical protein
MKQGQRRIATAPQAPRNDKTIRVVEYVHTAEGVVPVEALTAEQRETLRRWIVKTWVNTLYQGRAEVYYPEPAGETAGGQ